MTSPWMPTAQAAEYAGLKPAALTRLARLRRIQHGSDGRHLRFTREQIDAFFLANGYDGAQAEAS